MSFRLRLKKTEDGKMSLSSM